jgi:7-carboxy-7-deazaguanine synthase
MPLPNCLVNIEPQNNNCRILKDRWRTESHEQWTASFVRLPFAWAGLASPVSQVRLSSLFATALLGALIFRHSIISFFRSVRLCSPLMTQKTQCTAFVNEIFSSAQGEGVHIGRRQLFVRFCGCHRKCVYCDTPCERTDTVRIETVPGSGNFKQVPNPLDCDALIKLLKMLYGVVCVHDDLFLTGGEPLLHAEFLTAFLPQAKAEFGLPVHLETSGDLVDAFEQIADRIDHVLMDIKLPSVTGQPQTWMKHQRFMEAIHARRISTTIKLVVSADTAEEDLAEAIELMTATQTEADVVLQPMTAASKTDRVPTAQQVLHWQAEMACSLKRTVRIIPQSHKLMGLL